MAALAIAIEGKIWEDGGASLMARILGNDAVNLIQSALTALTYKVFDLSSTTPETETASGTLTISAVSATTRTPPIK